MLGEAFDRLAAKKAELAERVVEGRLTVEDQDVLVRELEVKELDEEKMKQRVRGEMEEAQSKAVDELRKSQAREVRDVFVQFYPDEDINSPQWLLDEMDLHSLAEQARKRQEDQAASWAQEQARLEAAEQAHQMELARQREQKLKAWEEAKAQEEARLSAEYEAKLAKLHEERAARRQAEAQQQISSLAASAASEAEKNALLKSLQADNERRHRAETVELERQRAGFQARLTERRLRAREAEEARLEKEAREVAERETKSREEAAANLRRQQSEREERVREALRVVTSKFRTAGAQFRAEKEQGVRLAVVKLVRNYRASTFGSASSSAATDPSAMESSSIIGTGSSGTGLGLGGGGGGAFPGVGDSGQPFLDKLARIEGLLTKLAVTNGQAKSIPTPAATVEESSPFADAKEASFVCTAAGSSPVVVAESELTAAEFIVFRLMQQLWDRVLASFPEHSFTPAGIRLQIASSLPVSAAAAATGSSDCSMHSALPGPSQCGVAKSVHLSLRQRSLYIRRERLSSPGEAAIIVLHTAAHLLFESRYSTSPSSSTTTTTSSSSSSTSAGLGRINSDWTPAFWSRFADIVRAVSAETLLLAPTATILLSSSSSSAAAASRTSSTAEESSLRHTVDAYLTLQNSNQSSSSGLALRMEEYRQFLSGTLVEAESLSSSSSSSFSAAVGIPPEWQQQESKDSVPPAPASVTRSDSSSATKADGLNWELTRMAEQLQETSATLLALQTSEKKQSDDDSDENSSQIAEAQRLQSKLRALTLRKNALLSAIESLEKLGPVV